jgi:hypothetical protein
MNNKLIGPAVLICVAFVVAACGGVARGDSSSVEVDDGPLNRPTSDTARVVVDAEQSPEDNTPVEEMDSQTGVVDPPAAIIDLPKPENDVSNTEFRWSQLLSRDSILPVYEPEFAAAANAPYDDEELVIGVAINGEAKAYAIGPLNGREMVNDTVGGTPVLVTW